MAILIAMTLTWLFPQYAVAFPTKKQAAEENADSLTVSLITCFPGPQIFELYGHEAIRVRGLGRDSVWNYGIFDFREPNFIYRFVKGETNYIGAGYPFAWFLPEYQERGSRVVEQDLNLSQPEAQRLLSLLQTSILPENRRYRYNYVKNNCATRIYQMIDSVVTSQVIYPDSVVFGTFRNEMRAYNRNYPWYQFGIDIALGSGIDYPLNAREEMFVPVEMMRMADGARLADGRPLVRTTRIINEGNGDVTLGPTPWYATPLFWSFIILAAALLICTYDLSHRHITKPAYFIWFLLTGIAGTIVAFLVFISSHEATSPNTLILWLNPLQLIMAVCVLWRKLSPLATALACYNIVACTCILAVWPFQHQSANPAIFPLLGATLLLAFSYTIIVWKQSYNKNRPISSPTGGQASRRRSGNASRNTAKKRNSANK